MRSAIICVRIAAGGLFGAIIVLSLIPIPPQPLTFNGVDKIEHGLAYALLAFLSSLGFLSRPARPARVCALLLLLVSIGAAIEVIQPSVGRNFDWFDMAFNTCGVLTGWLLSLLARGIKRIGRKAP